MTVLMAYVFGVLTSAAAGLAMLGLYLFIRFVVRRYKEDHAEDV